MDFCKGEIGNMFWSTRKCIKKVRLQLFQVYTTEIAEFFKKKYSSSWTQHEQEINEYVASKYKDKYLNLIAKASILGELSEEESLILISLQQNRNLEHCKMCLPEYKIKENRRVII